MRSLKTETVKEREEGERENKRMRKEKNENIKECVNGRMKI